MNFTKTQMVMIYVLVVLAVIWKHMAKIGLAIIVIVGLVWALGQNSAVTDVTPAESFNLMQWFKDHTPKK